MRFISTFKDVSTFTKFISSMMSVGPVAWLRLDSDNVRCTIAPEQGTQGAFYRESGVCITYVVRQKLNLLLVLLQESIFRTYTIQSAAENNAINLELPLDPLHRALKSAHGASSASLRLTKKDNVPLLALTIVRNTVSSAPPATLESASAAAAPSSAAAAAAAGTREQSVSFGGPARELEAIVTQNVPVLMLSAAAVEGIVEPRCREPDVHIILPALAQVKAISDRFTRIASGPRSAAANAAGGAAAALAGSGPRLELSANMHGQLRLSVRTDALSIASVWEGLTNPDLDPTQVEGGEEGIRNHPSTRMRDIGDDGDDDTSEEGWATVRIDGRDWSKVLSVGQLGGRVIACFIHGQALIVYVYLPIDDARSGEESVVTYYMGSYSA